MALSKELACLKMKPGLTSSQMFNTKSAQLQSSYMTPVAHKYYQRPNDCIAPSSIMYLHQIVDSPLAGFVVNFHTYMKIVNLVGLLSVMYVIILGINLGHA